MMRWNSKQGNYKNCAFCRNMQSQSFTMKFEIQNVNVARIMFKRLFSINVYDF